MASGWLEVMVWNVFAQTSSYLQFSNVAANCVRQCLKSDFKAAAVKRVESNFKVRNWENGKASPTPSKFEM